MPSHPPRSRPPEAEHAIQFPLTWATSPDAIAGQRHSDCPNWPIGALVRGDLDWIVMKAVEKDPSRRYSSAEALADDIRRHLRREAVTAAPPSNLYLLRKFTRRHRVLLSTAGAIAVSLLIALAFSSWAAINENRARIQLADEMVAKKNAVRVAVRAKERAEAERLQSKRIAYASDMKGADQALQLNDLGLARFYLDRNVPAMGGSDLRHWEWRALWRSSRGDAILSFGEETDRYESVCVSADGKWVATGGAHGAIRIWDFDSGKPYKTLVSRTNNFVIPTLAFSPTDDRLFGTTTYIDQSPNATHFVLKSWLLPSFDETNERIEFDEKWTKICISRDVSQLATLGANEVAVWQLPVTSSSKPVTRKLPEASVGSLAFSPNGKWLAVGLLSSTLILDAGDLGEVATISRKCNSVKFSPDSQFLATARGFPSKTIHLFSAMKGDRVGTLNGHSQYVADIAYSSLDGRFLASASGDGSVRIWNTQTLTEEAVLLGHNSEVLCLALTPDRRHLISGGIGDICVWDPRGRSAATDWPRSLDIVPYDTATGGWHRQYSQASFSHDTKWLATRNKDPRGDDEDLSGDSPRFTVSLRSPRNVG